MKPHAAVPAQADRVKPMLAAVEQAWKGDVFSDGQPAQKLLDSGLHLRPDVMIISTTYANYRNVDIGTSIVSIRFKMSEADALAAQSKK
ncbi:MAG: hypothetical protein ACK53L_11695 [Pirellulaceae bacterium]|jgi:hypothetical protein